MEEEYKEIARLKHEINIRLAKGTAYSDINDLARFLAQNRKYQELYTMENQFIRLQHFLTVWGAEKQKLPDLGISEDIFYQVHSLDELEQKYRRIEYYGLRIENNVPAPYCRELLDLLLEQKVSGIAFGIIVRNRTENGQNNLLLIAQELMRRLELPNAVLLLQYAREKYPDSETLLMAEVRCWIRGQQFQRAHELLQEIETPSIEIQKLIAELNAAH